VKSTRKKIRRSEKLAALAKPDRLPHVLLMVETSGAAGRGIIEGIGRYALEKGPWSIEYENRSLDSLPPEWLIRWRGDGIITRTVNARQAKILQATKLPLVELFGDPKISPIHVMSDYRREGEMAVEHFWNRGLRRFAYFSYGTSWWVKIYSEGYREALKKRGCDCAIYIPPGRERNVTVWDESQLPRLIDWLKSLPRPVGIFTPGDHHAMRLLNVCRELKIAVPEEMAILGRSNDPVICSTLRPTLSSIDLDARRVGYVAAELLDRRMNGEKTEDGVMFVPPSHVEIRQSTDLMVIDDADLVRAMQFIRDYACKNIDVPRVAEEVGLSRRVLERRFQKHLGRSPNEEIIRVRIETAKMLLARTDMSREAIARRCGFDSPSYFSTAFHRLVGMKPQAYRRIRRVSRES
jgi:LacI family transcriptional regulator